jgi:hypothetical protein
VPENMRNVSIGNKARGGEVLDSKEAIAQYKEWYFEFYGVKPTEKLIDTFCKMKGIEIEREREEVAKVEETKLKHSKLPWRLEIIDDEPTIVNADKEPLIAGTDDAFIVEVCNNYEALETNYQNLLSDYEEICTIAQEQAKIIERYQKAEIEALGGADG